MEHSYYILVFKSEELRTLERRYRKCENDTEICFFCRKIMRFVGLDSTGSGQSAMTAFYVDDVELTRFHEIRHSLTSWVTINFQKKML